jgi:hypothetical protein
MDIPVHSRRGFQVFSGFSYFQAICRPQNAYGYVPVHSRDFQGFSDFPIFRLFAGRKTLYGYTIHVHVPVHSRDFQGFSY